ncbi:MAG: hypothetical protein E6Q37_09590 [Crocinitomicaceae bacterium]|nr:MAG: hypothetical protein E6Q37_09590 [Crocinitomicaceae bacterium]
MKICKIRLKNIHALKGEHLIDFENGALGDAGLFVITGPTGSGKSTLLDVITLALFNRIPRQEKAISKSIVEDEGVILTKNTDDCYAEVEYKVNETVYRSSWSIRRTRTGSLDERKHELVNVTTNEILSSSRADVPTKNEQVIGLNYNQFTQSMILAQGQFSKLLLAKKDERNKLLEEITGTSVYRKIGAQVYFTCKEAEKKVREQELKMGETVLLTDEEIADLTAKKSTQIPLLEFKKKELQLVEQQKNTKNAIRKLETEQQQDAIDWKNYFQRKTDFASDAGKLQQHEVFAVFREPLIAIQSKKATLDHTETGIVQAQNEEASLTSQLQTLLRDAGDCVHQTITESDDFTHIVTAFRVKVQSLLDAESTAKRKVEQEENRLIDRLKLLNSQGLDLKQDAELEVQLKELIQSMEASIEASQLHDLASIQERKIALASKRLLAQQLLSNERLIQEKKESLLTLQGQVNSQEEQRSGLTQQLANEQAKLVQLNPLLLQAQEAFQVAQKELGLLSHRSELEDGKPCPLCGATHHPYAEKFENAQMELLLNRKNTLEADKSQLEKLVVRLEEQSILLHNSMEINKRECVLKATEIESVDTENIKLCDQLEWPLEQMTETWKLRSLAIESGHEALNKLEQDFRKLPILLETLEALKLVSTYGVEWKKAMSNRENVYRGNDIYETVENLLKTYNESNSSIKNVRNRMNELKNAHRADSEWLNHATRQLLIEVQAKGLNSLEALNELILTEDVASTLRSQKQALETEFVRLDSNKKRIELELQLLRTQDDSTATMEEIDFKLKQLKSEIEQLQQVIWDLQKQLSDNDEKKIHFQKQQEELNRLQKDLNLWSQMNILIGDASGKKFSNFVQDLTLKQLIEFGNKRLQGFSDRYLLKVDEASDHLNVIDTFMGNTQRSVSSLSGGETFKLSLALAFGLSDLAARNVNIESIFIDEGFGTLDSDSLDQAITILETMQHASNKSIGIISHVGELKERIGTKIKLIKSGAGYSKIEIE